MATKKKEEELAAPEAQSGYDTSGLENRQQVEEAMAGAGYRPGQSVTDAANALKEWQDKRPEAYQSSYQDRINEVLDRLLARENFAYSYTQDPLYRQYAQQYTQNAHNASADAAAQAAALTGGYGSSYAASAAQQAYQQQIGALNEAIPSLYSLALDTYTSGGDELVSRLDQLNAQEQSAQEQYDRQLSDYYTQLQQKGEDYNNAYAQDYGQYQDYLSRLDTLHGYYTAQEQAQASRRQQTFNGIMTVLGVIGDAIQLAISGTTGIGSLAGSLLNTGYNIVSGTRAYEADRADTAWNQQMQEKQRQDSLTQQRYENEASERGSAPGRRQRLRHYPAAVCAGNEALPGAESVCRRRLLRHHAGVHPAAERGVQGLCAGPPGPRHALGAVHPHELCQRGRHHRGGRAHQPHRQKALPAGTAGE